MNRPTFLALATLLASVGCGAAPAPEPTTAAAESGPPAAPADEPAPISGTVEDESGPAVVAEKSGMTPPVAATLDKDGIRRVIRGELAAVQKCYEEGLIRVPELKGTVTVSFQIEATGSVSSSSASGLGDSQVESCVAQVIEGARFPADQGRGIIVVSYPFTLRPRTD